MLPVFGFSLSELFVVMLVGIVVVGPRRLPELLRTAGTWIRKIQHLAADMRTNSGIDKILEEEGLADDIRQLRQLLRKRSVLDALSLDDMDLNLDLDDLTRPRKAKVVRTVPVQSHGDDLADRGEREDTENDSREYPEDGADSYGASGDRPDPYADSSSDEGPGADEASRGGSSDESSNTDGAPPPVSSPIEARDAEPTNPEGNSEHGENVA